jgi:hypothetical protein
MFEVAKVVLPLVARAVDNMLNLVSQALKLPLGDIFLLEEQFVDEVNEFNFFKKSLGALMLREYFFEVILKSLGEAAIKGDLHFQLQ